MELSGYKNAMNKEMRFDALEGTMNSNLEDDNWKRLSEFRPSIWES